MGSKKHITAQLSRNVENTETVNERISRPVPSLAGQGHDTENTKHTTAQLGRNLKIQRL